MKTKAKIVERLLEEKHITTEEAVILLQETGSYIPMVILEKGTNMIDASSSGGWVGNYTTTTSYKE